eukprot:4016192-Amphidinium_carterae.1
MRKKATHEACARHCTEACKASPGAATRASHCLECHAPQPSWLQCFWLQLIDSNVATLELSLEQPLRNLMQRPRYDQSKRLRRLIGTLTSHSDALTICCANRPFSLVQTSTVSNIPPKLLRA